MLNMDFPLYWRPPLQGNFFFLVVLQVRAETKGGALDSPWTISRLSAKGAKHSVAEPHGGCNVMLQWSSGERSR